MSSRPQPLDPTKKHRHDVGDPAHGPETTEAVTRAIQVLLGGAIIGSVALLFWTLALAAG